MTDSIGTARLDIVVDTSSMEAGVERAKKAQDGLAQASAKSSQAQQKAAQNAIKSQDEVTRAAARATASQEQNSKRQIQSLERQIAFLDKSRAEQLRWSIAQRTSGEEAARLNKILDAQEAKLRNGASQLNKYGVSAKQQAAALRGVPAQLTDIFTSLAGGQRPLTVLFQQGGQLKDMFGGIVPAARALGGAIAGLINPITLTIAAVGGLAYVWNTAEERASAFNKALILTGNYANTTADELAQMAARLDDTTTATQGKASEVLAQVASTGRFTAEQIDMVAEAAIRMEATTGQAIDETIRQFTTLAQDPVDALLKLNETQHFLSEETLRQVRTLQDQGDQAGATKVAVEAYFEMIQTRAPQAAEAMGPLESAWKRLASLPGEAFDGMVNGFQNLDRQIGESYGKLQQYLNIFKSGSGPAAFFAFRGASGTPTPGPVVPLRNPAAPGNGTVDSTTEKEAIAFKDRYLTREETKKNAIKELDRLRAHYTKEEYDILRKGIEERFKPPKGPKSAASGIESATSRAAIQAFEDQLKKEQGLLANQKSVLEANYAARNVLTADYYAEQKRLTAENTAAQERALEGEIAALQSRSLKGKDSINNARELAEKEALLAKVRADGATALEVLNIQEAAQLKQRQQANIAYQDALDQGREALKAELDSQVLRISVGEREFEIRSRIIQLYRDEAKELLNLARQRDAGEIDPETYKQRVEQLKAAVADEVRIVKDGYDAMADAQKNWANGALKAFADYQDAANDVAGQTYTIFSDSLRGLEDVFVDFFTKGKADWKGFFDSIAAEIIRFGVRQQFSKILKKFLPGGDGEGDNAAALSGAAASLAASAAPLYGAAAALSASAAALTAAGAGSAAAGGGGGDPTGGWLTMLGGLLNANGNAFNGGQVMAFANGGVFDRPTAFGMSGGRLGVMGEAGPEAVMPLRRGPDGKLGVVASAINRVVQQVTHIHVQGAPNRQTLEQIDRANGRRARRGMGRTGN